MPFFKHKTFFSKSEKLVVLMLLMLVLAGSGVNIYKGFLQHGSADIQAMKRLDDFEKEILTVVAEEVAQKGTKERTSNSEKRIANKEIAISLDINQATKEDFEQLPYIGPVIAQRIIEYRDRVGRFHSIDQIIEVKGIGIKTLDKLHPYLKIVN